MAEKHSRLTPAGRLVWFTERLWYLARGLPVRQVPIAPEPDYILAPEAPMPTEPRIPVPTLGQDS